MKYIPRLIERQIHAALSRNKSVLLLGARQTGKTTLIQRLKHDLSISFVRPDTRQRYEKNPALLVGEVEALRKKPGLGRPLVLLDEVQKVPDILDVVQDLIDRNTANFVLTGSSARKIKKSHSANMLPGRVVSLKIDPLTHRETADTSLSDFMTYGSLPGVLQTQGSENRQTDLDSYVTTYLEEEIRAEALVRNIGSFAKFLECAASESGKIVNFRKLSQEIGVSHTTIQSHYHVLEDCLIAERVEPITKSRTRKKLTRSEKYLIFDLGVRRIAANEGSRPPKEVLGHLFEHWVGLELVRYAHLSGQKTQVRFWRDPDGPEVDWVLEKEGLYIPIEVKWSASPSPNDLKHLKKFLAEYPNAKEAYLVCQTPRRVKFDKNIFAIPWQELTSLALQ